MEVDIFVTVDGDGSLDLLSNKFESSFQSIMGTKTYSN